MAENIFENTELQNTLSGDQQLQTQSPDTVMETDPPAKQSNTFQAKMENSFKEAASESFAPKQTTLAQELMDAKGANVRYHAPEVVDKYTSQSGFNPNLFEAEDEKYNQQEYARDETFGSAMGKAFDSFAFSFGNTFTGWFKDYPKMVDAIFSADWEKMKPDEESLINEYYAQQKNMNDNYVFVQPGEEDDIFNKKFLSEFVGNAGFAMGTVAAMSLEFLADAAITAATEGAGAASLFTLGTRASAKAAAREASREALEATAKRGAAQDFFTGFNVAAQPVDQVTAAFSTMKQAHQAEAIAALASSPTRTRALVSDYATMFSNNIFNIGKSKNLTEFVGNTLKGTPLLGTGIRYGEKMVAAGKAGASVAGLVGMGAQGARRLMQELNMSASESYFEAVSSYGDTLDKMYKQHIAETGEPPSQDDFDNMKSLATKSSSSNYDTNMGVLLVTNHLQFGNLFNRYIPANKVVKDLLAESSERIIDITGKNGLRGVIKKSAILGTVGSVGKIATEFGKKEAAYQLGRSVLKNVTRFELTEGLQENIQEMSAAGWKDYYAGQFNGTKYTLNDAMMNGMKQQFTKQGWKTFLMGAMTGSIIRIPTKVLNVSVEQANKAMLQNQYKKEGATNPYDAYEKRLDEDVAILNKFIKSAQTGKFEDRLFNFNTQTSVANEMTATANAGAVYNFENGKDNALLSAVAAANRIGTIDAFLKTVRTTIADMDAKTFKEEFGIDIEDTKYSSPQEFAEKVVSDVKKYSKSMDDFKRKYQTKFEDYSKYEPGTEDYVLSRYIRHAEEEALHIAALNSIKATMTLQRAQDVANELRKNPILANSSDMVLRTLSSRDAIVADLGNVQASIKVLQDTLRQEGLTPQLRKQSRAQLKALTAEAEALAKWYSFYDTRKALAEREGGDSKDITPVFVGRRSVKKSRHKDVSGIVRETNNVYNPLHREVLSVFKKVVLAKNKQAGITIDIKDSQIEEALAQLVDYIQLDTDTRDYLDTVEKLTDKENFKKVTKNLQNGYYKHKLIVYNDSFFQTFQEALSNISNDLNNTSDTKITQEDYNQFVADVQKELLDFKPYIQLTGLISDPHLGLEKQTEISGYQDKINTFIKKKFNQYIQKYTAAMNEKDISKEEFDRIMQEDELDYVREIALATKIIKVKHDLSKLTDKEKEVYEKFKEQVDLKIKELTLDVTDVTEDTTEEIVENDIETGKDEDTEDDDETVDDDDLEGEGVGSDVFGKMRNRSGKPAAEQEEDAVEEFEEDQKNERNTEEDILENEIEEVEGDITEEMVQSAFDYGDINEDQYNEYMRNIKTSIIHDKVNSFIHNIPITDMQSVIQNVISQIDVEAQRAGESFTDFVNNNEAGVMKIIEHYITEANEGADERVDEEIQPEPEIEPVEIITDKQDYINYTPDMSDIKDISATFEVESVINQMDITEANLEDIERNPENITNFTKAAEDVVTEESIWEDLRSNKFEC